MQVPSTTSTTDSLLSTESSSDRIPTQVLDQQDFLQLLVAQLTSQDPLNPQGDTEFIAQMAQFSALEQSKSMQTDMATLQATSLLGRTVEVQEQDGQVSQGAVSAVQIDAGKPSITVNGQSYGLSALLSIRPATTS